MIPTGYSSRGTYSVAETSLAGWSLTSATCDDRSDPSSITLDPGEIVTCTFTNTELSTIRVTKDANPTNTGDEFNIVLYKNSTPLDSRLLENTETGVFSDLMPGTYQLFEVYPAGNELKGWFLDHAICDGQSYDSGSNINLIAGQTINCTFYNIEKGKILVNKVTDPSGNPQDFDFELETPSYSIDTFSLSDADTPYNSGLLLPGTYSVSEDAITGWSLTSTACDDGSDPSSITLDPGETIICTFTNSMLPTLTLEKTVVKDNGGNATAADFQGKINGDNVSWGVSVTLTPGDYTASETTQVTGYEASDWGQDCAEDGSVTLTYGDNKICTITNDDQPAQITLTKVVNNDHGGNAVSDDFDLTIDSVVVLSGSTTNVNSNTAHTLSETVLTGYEFESIGGDAKCPSVLGGTVTLNEGEHISCTITNEDKPAKITLIKEVISNDGGTAGVNNFGLTVDSNSVNSGDTTEVDSNTSHTINEVGLNGYSFISITGDEKCPETLGGSVTLDEGEEITCTITNDDIAPTLKLVKNVIKDNGGTAVAGDWDLTATGVSRGFSDKGDSTTFHTITAGVTYLLTEVGPVGYTIGDWECDGGNRSDSNITLDLDENITCTITNDDNAPSLKLVKVVSGGTAVPADWILIASGPTSLSGQGPEVDSDSTFAAGTYDLSESGPADYSSSDWICEGGTPVDEDTITIDLGEEVICTITNTRDTGTLQVLKNVDLNGDGDSADGGEVVTQPF